jgi:hypothetical protein
MEDGAMHAGAGLIFPEGIEHDTIDLKII